MNSNGLRNLNCPIIKSALRAAYYPSKPDMPIPTCALMIMLTSFAPSPIASVMNFPFLFTRATTSAFYFGETLQQMTDEAMNPNLKNEFEISSVDRAWTRVSPSIIMQIRCFEACIIAVRALRSIEGVTYFLTISLSNFYLNSYIDLDDRMISSISV